MALSVTWSTKVINVLQADLTSLGGDVYELDTDQFRKDLNALQASAEGIVFDTTHEHTAPKTLAGTTFARFIEIINGYTVDFEDGQYQVNLVGSNNNILDVKTVNQVSLAVQNSAGLIQISTGSGLSAAQDTTLTNAGVNVAAILDELDAIEGTASHKMLMRAMFASICAKMDMTDNGDGTYTMHMRNMADTKDRITVTGPLTGGRTTVSWDMT